MRVVLHIGLHKTGTSALQVFLKRNAEMLAKCGVLYRVPGGPRETNHHMVMTSFLTEGQPVPFDGRAFLQGLIDEARGGPDTLLISSEMLCEPRVDAGAILNVLPRPVTAIAYLRSPDEIVESGYNWQVRDPHTRRVAPLSDGVAPYDDPTLLSVLSRWMRDDVNLMLAPYNRDQWRDGDLACDFLAMIGLKDVPDLTFTDERINASWPEGAVEMLRVFNSLPMEMASRTKLIGDVEALWRERRDLFPRGPLLSDEQRAVMRRAMAEALPQLRPYYREGFDDRYLTEAPGE